MFVVIFEVVDEIFCFIFDFMLIFGFSCIDKGFLFSWSR